ncbi:hypothetical protein [Rhizobium sp.]
MRLHASAPSPNTVLFGSAAWGVLMMLSTLSSIWLNNGLLTATPLALVALYFYGGSLAFAPGLWLASFLFGRRGTVPRFLGGAAVMLLATHTTTSAIFALQYRIFYAQWHSAFPSLVWLFQFGFTSAAAVYQYSVDSLYHYWPAPMFCLFGFGWWFARTNRSPAH